MTIPNDDRSQSPRSNQTLTIEQQFRIRQFAQEISELSQEQTQEKLLEVIEQSMLRDNYYKEILKHEWNL